MVYGDSSRVGLPADELLFSSRRIAPLEPSSRQIHRFPQIQNPMVVIQYALEYIYMST